MYVSLPSLPLVARISATSSADPDLTEQLGIAITIAAVLVTVRVVSEQTWLSFFQRAGGTMDDAHHDIAGVVILGLALLWVCVVALLGFMRRRRLTLLQGCLVAMIAICAALWEVPGEEWRLLTSQLEGARRVPDEWIVHAAAQGEVRLLGFLVSQGANPNARVADGQTALGAAAAEGQLRACQLLIDGGARIDGRTGITRETPLIEAAAEGRFDVIRLLLAHGADTTARDFVGLSAGDWAAQSGDAGMLRLLRGAQGESP